MKSFLFRPFFYSWVSLMMLCFLHYFLITLTPLKVTFPVINYYIILIFFTLGVIVLSLIWFFKNPEQINAGFFFGSVMKIIIVSYYIFFVLKLESKTDKIHIALLYVLSLFIEIFFVGKTLNRGIK